MAHARKFHEALGILLMYVVGETDGIHQSHDQVWLPGPGPSDIHPDDLKRLKELGLIWDEEEDAWFVFT